jgi:hypothetical protein
MLLSRNENVPQKYEVALQRAQLLIAIKDQKTGSGFSI